MALRAEGSMETQQEIKEITVSDGKVVSELTRRNFLGKMAGAAALPLAGIQRLRGAAAPAPVSDVYFVKDIPDDPFYLGIKKSLHLGIDSLLHLMGRKGLKFYRTAGISELGGPDGLIGSDDVVLVKVNAQWKYRGATNSDLVRGLVRRLLDHPERFTGEVVLVENGQGRGSLACDTRAAYPDSAVHANANDERHSFLYLVDRVFHDPRVSAYLLDPIAGKFLVAGDHATDGYRVFENVSYPCFTTAGGRRVELRRGVWKDGAYRRNLKLINVPVLKHHDTGGSEITACLKHTYGLVSMKDGQGGFRHYHGLGETCGKMMASVCAPVLNILDATWVSHQSITGYPASTTRRLNKIAASRDPVALDAWAARNLLYPIDHNLRHRNDHPNVDAWLSQAEATINTRGGLRDHERRVVAARVTKKLEEIRLRAAHAGDFL